MDPSSIVRPEEAPRAVPDGPRDLPDFEEASRVRLEFAEEWGRVRNEILLQQRGNDSESHQVIASLQDLSTAYLSSKAQILENAGPGMTIGSTQIFESLSQLQQKYRIDVQGMIGESALVMLEAEKKKIESRLAMGAYTIPLDTY